MHLLITNSIVTVLHLLTGVTSLIHLAFYYCFVIWVPFKLQITLECYIMFIFSKLTSFSMVLWLMQGKHGLQSFPLSITRGILHHKISVWNVFWQIYGKGFGKYWFRKVISSMFFNSSSLAAPGNFLVSTSLDCMSYRELGANSSIYKSELSRRPYKTSYWHFVIVSNGIRFHIY